MDKISGEALLAAGRRLLVTARLRSPNALPLSVLHDRWHQGFAKHLNRLLSRHGRILVT